MKSYAVRGLREFVLCLGYKGWLIKEFFLNYPAWAYADKRALLTGHSGFEGGWLAVWLSSLGACVCVAHNRDLSVTSSIALHKLEIKPGKEA